MKTFIQEKLLSENGTIHSKKVVKEWFVSRGYESQYQEIFNKTQFLENPTFPQRLYHLFHEIESNVMCLNCGEKPPTFGTFRAGYNLYCSVKCSVEHTKEQRKETMIERYGEFPLCSKESVEKRKKTNLEKYGVEFPFQNKEIQNKLKQW